MPELVTLDLETIAEKVQEVLPAFPEVAGAYLFGSALGPCRPDSDIDLGLIVDDSRVPVSPHDPLRREREEERIAMALGYIQGHPFHVTILDSDEAIFSFRAVASGRLVYLRDEPLLTTFLERVALRYRETHPRYMRALHEIAEGV